MTDTKTLQKAKKNGDTVEALADKYFSIIYAEVIEYKDENHFVSYMNEVNSRPGIDKDEAATCIAYSKGWIKRYKQMPFLKTPFKSIYLRLKAGFHRSRYKEIENNESVKVVKV